MTEKCFVCILNFKKVILIDVFISKVRLDRFIDDVNGKYQLQLLKRHQHQNSNDNCLTSDEIALREEY